MSHTQSDSYPNTNIDLTFPNLEQYLTSMQAGLEICKWISGLLLICIATLAFIIPGRV